MPALTENAAVLLGLVLLVLAIGVFAPRRRRKWLQRRRDTNWEAPKSRDPVGYQRCTSLLTPVELRFYSHLERLLDPQHLLQVKVRLADVVTVRDDAHDWQTKFNQIASKHSDYVVCDRGSLRPLLVIELDDASHQRSDRRARDAFVDDVCAAAGIPILHVPVGRWGDVNKLKSDITSLIGGQ